MISCSMPRLMIQPTDQTSSNVPLITDSKPRHNDQKIPIEGSWRVYRVATQLVSLGVPLLVSLN